jgi:ABC-2 type transport system ATP-binding protein
MIFSLIKPTTGSVELFGHDLHKQRELALKKVTGIVEKPDFYLYLSAFRNMQIAGSLTLGKTPDRNKILETLRTVGLAERAFDRVKTYSHGMKQRLGIAQALLTEPELVLLDEPTNGLDPQGMKEVRELITKLSTERGITIFLSSHLLHEVEQVATRMAIINKGEMVVQGSVKELLKVNANTILLKAEPKKKILSMLKKIKTVSEPAITDEGITAKIEHINIPHVIEELVTSGCKVFAIQPKDSLEEYFLSITAES